MRAKALPAICDESTGPSRLACRQMSCTTAMQTRLPAWSTIIGTNQVGSIAVSRGAVEKTSIRLGASRYSETPVRARNSTRRVRLLTGRELSPENRNRPHHAGGSNYRPHQDGQGYVP